MSLDPSENGDSLGVWFKDEIENTLLAVDAAQDDISSEIDTPEMRIYRRGYRAALRSVATAFGIRRFSDTSDRAVTTVDSSKTRGVVSS